MKVHVVFYSTYGHIYQMAEAVAEGARAVAGAGGLAVPGPRADARRGAGEERREGGQGGLRPRPGRSSPTSSSRPTRSSSARPPGSATCAAQMRNFLDQTGQIWFQGGLIGKVGSVFASTASQHGGQETTITSFHSTLLHHGMIIVGVPYSEPGLVNMAEITGGTPYGATTLAGTDGKRQPTENELTIARFQGKHVAEIAAKLAAR